MYLQSKSVPKLMPSALKIMALDWYDMHAVSARGWSGSADVIECTTSAEKWNT